MKIALFQITCENDIQKNIALVEQALVSASEASADLLMLPEMSLLPYENAVMQQEVTDLEDSELLHKLQFLAKEHAIWLCSGSLPLRRGSNIYNMAHLIDPQGNLVLQYAKQHLFKIDTPELRFNEGDLFTAGETLEVVDTPFGRIAILICFDLRFPEEALNCFSKEVDILLCPANFNQVTGPLHWDLLTRTRALDSGAFLVAASQAKAKDSSYPVYGHSRIIDPWGALLAEIKPGQDMIFADIDVAEGKKIKTRLGRSK